MGKLKAIALHPSLEKQLLEIAIMLPKDHPAREDLIAAAVALVHLRGWPAPAPDGREKKEE